ncbi:MAG: hypothetical protein V4813_08505 [Gemmatimonadota bacterium]
MITVTTRSRLGLAGLALLAASPLRAQGAISLQGFGYPPGQLTTRAASTGGALGEFDQAAPLNPAALMNWGVGGAYLQYSPERRSTSVDGVESRTTVARFPVFAIGLPLGGKYAFGISSSTLLERNYTTTVTARQLIRTDSVTTTSVATARGAMNDVRFGGAMQVNSWLRVGTALHIVTGENRVRTLRSIAPDTGARTDTVSYSSITENSSATFGGSGISVGVELQPLKKLSLAGSARLGFGMRVDLNDSTRRTADAPSRAGAALRWEVGGTNIAARYNWEGWTAMKGLGSDAGGIFDSHEFGVGAEVPGPKIRGGQMLLRIGARSRELPFGIAGNQPSENVFGGGLGFPLGFGRAQVDLGLERATRKVPGFDNLSERGLIMSFGFRLRT